MLINAIIAIGLVSKIGFISAAIATSVAGWSMLFLLWQGSRKFEDAIKFDDTTLKNLIIIVISSIIMGICVFAGKSYLITLLHDKQMKYLGLIILIFIGIITYFLTKITLEKIVIK
jgi:putative peptidoglycan lipid II flippase